MSPRPQRRGPLTRGSNRRWMCVGLVVLTLSACATSPLPNKTAPQRLGLSQTLGKTASAVTEFIVCDWAQGPWPCADTTAKTPIQTEVSALDGQAAPPAAETATGFSAPERLEQPFHPADRVGALIATVSFAFDRHDLSADSQRSLRKQLAAVSSKPLLLLGFTDNVGTQAYNDALARQRAQSVKAFLTRHGVSASDIRVEGKGMCCYLLPNRTEAQRTANRRVEVYLADDWPPHHRPW